MEYLLNQAINTGLAVGVVAGAAFIVWLMLLVIVEIALLIIELIDRIFK